MTGAILTHPVDTIKVVLPPRARRRRVATNYICPSQRPAAAITTTKHPDDTLMRRGGSLPINQQFTLNVQTSPGPRIGTGGQLLAHLDGRCIPPFSGGGP